MLGVDSRATHLGYFMLTKAQKTGHKTAKIIASYEQLHYLENLDFCVPECTQKQKY